MKKVSIINFKGGVGKTTLSFHLACHLSLTSKVLVIDVDHQSSLSLILLGADLWAKVANSGNTVNKIFQSFSNHRIKFPGQEIIFKNPIWNRHKKLSSYNLYPNLDLVPAQFELDDTEIDLASTTIGNASASDWEKRTLVARWLDEIEAADIYDYVIFDCPPATKIVSQNALAASGCYIVPVIPDELSSRGVSHFVGLVERKIDKKLDFLKNSAQIEADLVPASYEAETLMAAIAPSLVKQAGRAESGFTNIHTEQLAALRSTWGEAVLETESLNYIAIPEAINAGWPVWSYWGQNARPDVKNLMKDICEEAKDRIDAT